MQKKNIIFISFVCIMSSTISLFASGKKDSVVENINDGSAVTNADAQPEIVSSDATDAPSDSPSDSEAIEVWPSSVETNENEKQTVAYHREMPSGNPASFHEVWAYVLEGRESDFSSDMPITDLCIVSADVNIYGEITHIPDVSKIKDFQGRKH